MQVITDENFGSITNATPAPVLDDYTIIAGMTHLSGDWGYNPQSFG